MSQAMMNLVKQHTECDDQLNRCEAALQKGDIASAGRNFRLFSEFLDSHFALEENKLFPAFEKATGMTQGPTEVMRGEHAEIRSLRDEAYAAIEGNHATEALAAIDILNVLIQQHNVKEEISCTRCAAVAFLTWNRYSVWVALAAVLAPAASVVSSL